MKPERGLAGACMLATISLCVVRRPEVHREAIKGRAFFALSGARSQMLARNHKTAFGFFSKASSRSFVGAVRSYG
jgi:hypothetical protein